MPERKRPSAASRTETTKPEGPPRTERSKKIITGRVMDEVRTRDVKTQYGTKKVAEFHVSQDTPEGQVNWTVAAWNGRGEEAWAKLEPGDEVKIMGRWEPDFEGATSRRTHQLTASESIGVSVGGEFVGVEQFDRSMLDNLKTTETPDILKGVTVADEGPSLA